MQINRRKAGVGPGRKVAGRRRLVVHLLFHLSFWSITGFLGSHVSQLPHTVGSTFVIAVPGILHHTHAHCISYVYFPRIPLFHTTHGWVYTLFYTYSLTHYTQFHLHACVLCTFGYIHIFYTHAFVSRTVATHICALPACYLWTRLHWFRALRPRGVVCCFPAFTGRLRAVLTTLCRFHTTCWLPHTYRLLLPQLHAYRTRAVAPPRTNYTVPMAARPLDTAVLSSCQPVHCAAFFSYCLAYLPVTGWLIYSTHRCLRTAFAARHFTARIPLLPFTGYGLPPANAITLWTAHLRAHATARFAFVAVRFTTLCTAYQVLHTYPRSPFQLPYRTYRSAPLNFCYRLLRVGTL